jgi:hypothetical protein
MTLQGPYKREVQPDGFTTTEIHRIYLLLTRNAKYKYRPRLDTHRKVNLVFYCNDENNITVKFVPRNGTTQHSVLDKWGVTTESRAKGRKILLVAVSPVTNVELVS